MILGINNQNADQPNRAKKIFHERFATHRSHRDAHIRQKIRREQKPAWWGSHTPAPWTEAKSLSQEDSCFLEDILDSCYLSQTGIEEEKEKRG